MRVAAVVLDMDGLVLDTEPLYKAVWQEAALWRLRVAHTGIPLKPGLLEFLSFVEGQRLPIAAATSVCSTTAAFRVLRSLHEAQHCIFMLLTDGHCTDTHRSRSV